MPPYTVDSHPTWSVTPSAGLCISYGNCLLILILLLHPQCASAKQRSRYGNMKDIIQNYRGPHGKLTSLDYFAASGTSGVLSAILTNPIWVIKTRMLSTGRNAPGAYAGMWHGLGEILRQDGPKGLWRGLVPSLFGISHGAVQFAAYEQLKNYRAKEYAGHKERLTNWDFLALSGISKCFAGSVTYPYQVVRVRLQMYNAESTYTGAKDAVLQTWRNEGIRGFYKG
jgi:solute carrier family 25 folate transporter 32